MYLSLNVQVARENNNLKILCAFNVNDILCMDLVGLLPLYKNKNKYMLSLMDQFSRFVIADPILEKSAKTVIRALYLQVIQGQRR